MTSSRKQTQLKNTKRHPVQLAEVAFNELSLPGTLKTQADQERLWRIWRGLKWLDDDQAQLRGTFHDILSDYAKDRDATALVDRLQKLDVVPPGKVHEEVPPSDLLKGMTEVSYGVWRARQMPQTERWEVTWVVTPVRSDLHQDEALTLAQHLASKVGQSWSSLQVQSFARRLAVAWKQMGQVMPWLSEANIKTVVEWSLEKSPKQLATTGS
jgi:hypothetical protein